VLAPVDQVSRHPLAAASARGSWHEQHAGGVGQGGRRLTTDAVERICSARMQTKVGTRYDTAVLRL
jgi:hypothetical protein